MRHTLTHKCAQAPELAHHLLVLSAGSAVYQHSTPSVTICVGDRSYCHGACTTDPMGRFGGYSDVPHALSTRGRS
jgi:hypothetical protein